MYDSLTPELFLSIQTPSLVLKRLLICLTRRQIASRGAPMTLVPTMVILTEGKKLSTECN